MEFGGVDSTSSGTFPSGHDMDPDYYPSSEPFASTAIGSLATALTSRFRTCGGPVRIFPYRDVQELP